MTSIPIHGFNWMPFSARGGLPAALAPVLIGAACVLPVDLTNMDAHDHCDLSESVANGGEEVCATEEG